jgi:hypothetical protein
MEIVLHSLLICMVMFAPKHFCSAIIHPHLYQLCQNCSLLNLKSSSQNKYIGHCQKKKEKRQSKMYFNSSNYIMTWKVPSVLPKQITKRNRYNKHNKSPRTESGMWAVGQSDGWANWNFCCTLLFKHHKIPTPLHKMTGISASQSGTLS